MFLHQLVHHHDDIRSFVVAIPSSVVPSAGGRISAVEVGSLFIDNISTYLGLQVKCNPACPVLNRIEFYQQISIFHS
jgi:hypothetical protein